MNTIDLYAEAEYVPFDVYAACVRRHHAGERPLLATEIEDSRFIQFEAWERIRSMRELFEMKMHSPFFAYVPPNAYMDAVYMDSDEQWEDSNRVGRNVLSPALRRWKEAETPSVKSAARDDCECFIRGFMAMFSSPERAALKRSIKLMYPEYIQGSMISVGYAKGGLSSYVRFKPDSDANLTFPEFRRLCAEIATWCDIPASSKGNAERMRRFLNLPPKEKSSATNSD